MMFAGGAPRAKLEMLNVTFQIDFGSVDLSIFDDRRRTFDWKGGRERKSIVNLLESPRRLPLDCKSFCWRTEEGSEKRLLHCEDAKISIPPADQNFLEYSVSATRQMETAFGSENWNAAEPYILNLFLVVVLARFGSLNFSFSSIRAFIFNTSEAFVLTFVLYNKTRLLHRLLWFWILRQLSTLFVTFIEGNFIGFAKWLNTRKDEKTLGGSHALCEKEKKKNKVMQIMGINRTTKRACKRDDNFLRSWILSEMETQHQRTERSALIFQNGSWGNKILLKTWASSITLFVFNYSLASSSSSWLFPSGFIEKATGTFSTNETDSTARTFFLLNKPSLIFPPFFWKEFGDHFAVLSSRLRIFIRTLGLPLGNEITSSLGRARQRALYFHIRMQIFCSGKKVFLVLKRVRHLFFIIYVYVDAFSLSKDWILCSIFNNRAPDSFPWCINWPVCSSVWTVSMPTKIDRL